MTQHLIGVALGLICLVRCIKRIPFDYIDACCFVVAGCMFIPQ